MDFRRTYRAAAVAVADLVSRVPADRWDGPGLGVWTLRDLLGHTVTAGLRPIEPAPAGTGIEVESPEEWWARVRAAPPEVFAAAVRRSTDGAATAGKDLGDNPAETVRDHVGRATAALADARDDDVVTTLAGGIRVRDWLPTRTFELVVHGLDIAAAAGVPFDVPAPALAEATAQAARMAVTSGNGPAVLRALTGRDTLPDAFSVV
jgi:uncharacterized protein (TIGR03083 family)